jgi:predicted CXXCH cytochrome family protein
MALFTRQANPLHPNVNDVEIPQLAQGARFLEDERGVRVEVPNGASRDQFEVAYAIGIRPLQQLVVRMPKGHLQSLTVAWNVDKKEWYSLYPTVLAPGDPLHFSQQTQNFSSMCGDCHTTGFDKGFDLQSNSYDTRWKEIAVGCEQCHGPGSRHLAWAKSTDKSDPSKGLAVRGKDQAAEQLVDACAQCHSQRRPLTKTFNAGEPFLDQYQPLLLDEGQYFPDGQIEGEVYEYGSFLQSKMFARGVKCTDCHNAHSGKVVAQGNGLCVQCHSESPPPRFSSLAKKHYDGPEHHKHSVGSQGAQCVNCHMRDRTYMGIDPRRDHSFRIPRPSASVALGTPNACNGCHTDRTAAWAVKEVDRLWGAHPDRPDRYDFARTFAAARRGDRSTAAGLVRILRDQAQPAIVRATAVKLVGSLGIENPLEAIEEAAHDAHPLVRFAAAGALPPLGRGAMAQRLVKLLAKLLGDTSRLVRAEAGRVAGGIPDAMWSPPDRPALLKARGDFLERERANEERPDAHVTLAIDSELRGNPKEAKAGYEQALKLAPGFVPAHLNLATLLARDKNVDEAERHLRAAVASEPNSGPAHYALGLLLLEAKRPSDAEALTELRRATQLMPNQARPLYTLGLMLEKKGDSKGAVEALMRALSLSPTDADVLYALAFHHTSQKQTADAKKWLERLRAAHPDDRRLKALGKQLDNAK